MKTKLILSLTILSLFYCCEKEDKNNRTEELDTYIVVGDGNASITTLDTLITPEDRCDSIVYKIDIDSNGIDDLAFYIYYCYSPSKFSSTFRFDCLTDKIKVLTNDSIISPEILNYGDTLNFNKYWVNESMEILSASGSSEMTGEAEMVQKFGNWFDLSEKYIGLLIENDENPIYGWIKLSVPDDDWICSLTIHEIGYKKAAYSTQ